MLFTKKSVVKIFREGKGFSSEATTAKLNDAQLLNYLKENFNKYGELTITSIRDNEIKITTNKTLEYREVSERMQDLHELIYDFVSKD